MNKIIIAHPLQQHSYRTAEAFVDNKTIHSYLTTVYFNPEKFLYKLLGIVLKNKNKTKMKKRINPKLNKYIKQYNELIGLIYLLIFRIDKLRIIEPTFYNFMIKRFGNNVVKHINKNPECDTILMYDITAYYCFKKMQDKNIIKILDMSSAAAPYIREILLKEKELDKKFINSINTKLKSYSKSKIKKYEKEIQYADYFFVPSTFVKESLEFCGIDSNKIFIIPYGVDTSMFTRKTNYNVDKKINFLYVGRMEAAKGIYYLLETFKNSTNKNIKLTLVGSCIDKEIEEYIKECDNIEYLGSKNKEEMSSIYQKCDVYIMPSLWEGLSLTIFEAMASGLPVIATSSSGAKGIIKDYKEGFVINSGSISELSEKIEWFSNNKSKISEMGKNAEILSRKYTWDNYKKNIDLAIKEIQKQNKQ